MYMQIRGNSKSIVTKAHYYSRSRQSLWCKGKPQGTTKKSLISQLIVITTHFIPCNPNGLQAACHTGHENCFINNSK